MSVKTNTTIWCDRARIGFAATMLHAVAESCYEGTKLRRFSNGPVVAEAAARLVSCAVFDVSFDQARQPAWQISNAADDDALALRRDWIALARCVEDRRGFRCYALAGGVSMTTLRFWGPEWRKGDLPPLGVLAAPWRLLEARQRGLMKVGAPPERDMSYAPWDAFVACAQLGKIRQGCEVAAAAYRAAGVDPATWTF